MGRRERVRHAGGRVRRVPRQGSEPLPWLAAAGLPGEPSRVQDKGHYPADVLISKVVK